MCQTRTMPLDVQLRRTSKGRAKLTDIETETRMLDAGVKYVTRQGLSLSLEHLSMEDLIKEAGVSRTSSYRRWPTKDHFAADLLLRLATAAEMGEDLSPLVGAMGTLSADLFDDLASEQGRRDLVVEVLRAIMSADFHAMLDSPQSRTFIVLRAAHIGLPDGDVRSRVAEIIRHTEQDFARTRAVAFELLSRFIGYRLRQPDAIGWHQLSVAIGSQATGTLIRAYADRDGVTGTRLLRPFGSSRDADWSSATLASVGMFLDATEPDPDVTWGDERIAEVRAWRGRGEEIVELIAHAARQASATVPDEGGEQRSAESARDGTAGHHAE